MMPNIAGNIRSHLNSLNMKKTYDVGNPRPDLRQAHKCGGNKPVNEIPTLFLYWCIVIQRLLLANRPYLLNQRALYICGVSIVRFYKSDLLVNIYFGGYMKRKRKKILLCFIFLFFYWLWTHYCKLIMLKWDNWFH
jgi:hypothetical protein